MQRRGMPVKRVKLPFKKGDVVVALSGDDKGKRGKVLQVLPRSGRVLVEGLNQVKKHMKKSADNPQGGIVEKEAPMPACKLRKYQPAEESKAAKHA